MFLKKRSTWASMLVRSVAFSFFFFPLCCGLVGGIRVALARSGSDFFFPSMGIQEKLISTLALKCLKNSSLLSEEMYIVPPAVLCPGVSCFVGSGKQSLVERSGRHGMVESPGGDLDSDRDTASLLAGRAWSRH